MQDKCKQAIAKEIYLAYSSPAHFRSRSLIFVTATRLMRVDSSRRDRVISFDRRVFRFTSNYLKSFNDNNVFDASFTHLLVGCC